MPEYLVEVDGRRFATDFNGFARPLVVCLADSAVGRVPPWTYRNHLAALRDCGEMAGGHLSLDAARFARRVLADSDIDQALHDDLAPLALWWAAGGDDAATAPMEADAAGWHPCGARRARLRPWSERERLRALSAAIVEPRSGERWFDPIAYLDAMIRASVIALDPPGSIDDLDAGTTVALLDAVVGVNIADPEEDADPMTGPAARDAARGTLALCRALGRTPSEVWAMPAPEVNRLLRLIALAADAGTRPASAAPRRASRLADYPDAVVIEFE